MEVLERKIFFPLFMIYCSCVNEENPQERRKELFYYWNDVKSHEQVDEMINNLKNKIPTICPDFNGTIDIHNVNNNNRLLYIKLLDRQKFFKAMDNYIKKVKEASLLEPAKEENPYICKTLLPFKKQAEIYQDWLYDYCSENDYWQNIFLRKDTIKEKIKKNYHQFCFEELIIHLHQENLLTITSIEEPKIYQDKYFPGVMINYSAINWFHFRYDHKRKIIKLPESYGRSGYISINNNPKYMLLAVLIKKAQNRQYLSAKNIEESIKEEFGAENKRVKAHISELNKRYEDYGGIIDFKEVSGRGNKGGYRLKEPV